MTVRTAFRTAAAIVCAAVLSGCVSFVGAKPLGERVRRDAVFFPLGTIDAALVEKFAAYDTVLLGESHYVREHQEFLVSLLESTADRGFTLLLAEGMHAYGWIVEDYVLGLSDELPRPVRFFENELIEGIRRLNRELPPDRRIGVSYFDMNHWRDVFIDSLRRAETALDRGPEPLFAEFLSFPPEEWVGGRYSLALETLASELESRERELSDGSVWGERWYERIRELVEVERRSLPLRNRMDDREREAIIIELCLRRIAEHQGRTYINTGMYHAQKERFMGTRVTRLGEALAGSPEAPAGKVFSVAFIALTGDRKHNFADRGSYRADIPGTSRENDLVRILAMEAGNRMAFLPLEDPLFASSRIRVTYGMNDTHVLPPARQFDAYVTYPRVTLPPSMSEFAQ